MNSPTRLLESSPNPAARSLLQAGLRERPRPAALRATALALGVGGSLTAASASAAAGTAGTAGVVPLVAPSLTLMLGKWVMLGVVGGVTLAGGASLVSAPTAQNDTSPKAAAASQRSQLASAAAASPGTTPEPSRQEIEVGDVAPRAAAAISKPSLSAATPVVSARSRAAPASGRLPNAQSLSREIAMIDAARRALASGSAAAALAQLDEYAALPRTRTLDREAQLLRIDALVLSGQRAAALALAKQYLASYPNDPHAVRLRELSRAP